MDIYLDKYIKFKTKTLNFGHPIGHPLNFGHPFGQIHKILDKNIKFWTSVLLFATLIKKPFLTQLIFGGGPINAQSGLVEVTV